VDRAAARVSRKSVLTAVAAVCALLGLAAIASGLWIPVKAALARGLIADAWDRTKAGEPAVKPWPWADTYPVARLRIASVGLDMPVLAGATGRTLAFAPGHLDGTALPGEPGTSVIAGHRDTSFRALERLADGAAINVETADGRTSEYRVTRREVVDSRDAWQLRPTAGRSLALVTCYPFDAFNPGGPLRFVVEAVEEAGPVEK
jgi:sortase A